MALRRRATAIAVAALLVLAIPVGLAVGGGTTAPEDGPPFLEGPLTSAGTFAVDRVARTTAITRFARLGLPVYCGAGNRPWVALTFDDGPGALSDRFRELLVKERAAVTLFRQGTNIAGHEDAVRAQRDLGWDSGSHTQRHAALASLPAKEQRAEIEAGNRTSRSVLGRPVRLFRPPYESHNADTDRIVEDLGMVQVLWNVDTQDALGVGVDKIVSQAKAGMRAGSIILMHETKATTLKALPQIFAEMRRRGLQPVTVSQMLAHDPPSEAQLRKGFAGCPVDVTPGKAAS
ncbi:MAG: polysaccharide deacetylase family protein [Solirubrobacteraceae bacterium]